VEDAEGVEQVEFAARRDDDGGQEDGEARDAEGRFDGGGELGRVEGVGAEVVGEC
jgi:hypothetical protein